MFAVLQAIRDLIAESLAGLDATVVVGPPAALAETPVVVTVGLGINEESPVTVTDEPIGAGSRSDQSVMVRCLAMVSGQVDADLADLAEQITTVVDRVTAAVATDRQLGGVAADAWIGGVQRFWPGRTSEAAFYTSAFDVQVTVLAR